MKTIFAAATALALAAVAPTITDVGTVRASRSHQVFLAEANGPSPGGHDTGMVAEASTPSPGGHDTALAEANTPSPGGRDNAQG